MDGLKVFFPSLLNGLLFYLSLPFLASGRGATPSLDYRGEDGRMEDETTSPPSHSQGECRQGDRLMALNLNTQWSNQETPNTPDAWPPFNFTSVLVTMAFLKKSEIHCQEKGTCSASPEQLPALMLPLCGVARWLQEHLVCT